MNFISYGDKWKGSQAFKLVPGSSNFAHYSGGTTWGVPYCPKCGERMHQIFNLDVQDPKLKYLGIDNFKEIPFISCLNCSIF